MRTDVFDFPLAPERIALRPVHPRDAARLLVVRPGQALEDRVVRDLPDLLRPGDQLVVNDTRVIPASLSGRRIGRGPETRIEANLVKRLDGSRWLAFVKPAKRLAAGDVVRFGDEGKVCFLGQLDATVEAKGEGGEVTLAFAFHGAVLDQAVDERGDMPLPPYIAARRAPDDGPRRLPDAIRPRRGLGRGANSGSALHRCAARAPEAARRRAAHRDAACRRRHVPPR